MATGSNWPKMKEVCSRRNRSVIAFIDSDFLEKEMLADRNTAIPLFRFTAVENFSLNGKSLRKAGWEAIPLKNLKNPAQNTVKHWPFLSPFL